jgi:hypothetical protein
MCKPKPPRPSALTLMCPIKNGCPSNNNRSYTSLTREYLQNLDIHERSPVAKVPNTFFARFFILDDVPFQGAPAKEEHLKSRYLVIAIDFHGKANDYLRGFWLHANEMIMALFQHCVGFESVNNEKYFLSYIEKCTVSTCFNFVGSPGNPLSEQLKALYLKQEFSQFAVETQGLSASQLRQAFCDFITRTQPDNLDSPTWYPGKNSL